MRLIKKILVVWLLYIIAWLFKDFVYTAIEISGVEAAYLIRIVYDLYVLGPLPIGMTILLITIEFFIGADYK